MDDNAVSSKKRQSSQKLKTGCKTCRTRHVKCDETKPVCKRCTMARRPCEWYIPRYSYPSPLGLLALQGERVSRFQRQHPRVAGSSDMRDILYLSPMLTTSTRSEAKRDNNISEFTLSRTRELTSYLFHIPSRAGHEPCLDIAVSCLAASLRELFSQNQQQGNIQVQERTLSLYSTALKQLQEALNDPIRSRSAETLCATELLCIFEGICGENGDATIQHAKGASRLIQHRGPQHFKSDFELSLLANQIPITATESLWNTSSCFLDTDEWMAVMQSSILLDTPTTDRSEILISYFMHSIPNSTILVACISFITSQETPDHEQTRRKLLTKVVSHRAKYLRWYNSLAKLQNSSSISHDRWLDICHMAQANLVVLSRLCIALGTPQARTMERHTLGNVTKLMEIYTKKYETTTRQANAMIILPGCLAVMKTTQEWEEHIVACSQSLDASSTKLINPEIFIRWARMSGFKIG